MMHVCSCCYALVVVSAADASVLACPPVLLRLGRLRFGKGVVGSLGGTLTVSLSPSSVSFVTLRPVRQSAMPSIDS